MAKKNSPSNKKSHVLARFVGKEINVFGIQTCEEHENCLGSGFLTSIEDGFLLLSENTGEIPDLAIALQEVTCVVVIKDQPGLTSVPGGKSRRILSLKEEKNSPSDNS